jgi:hypothetical protein
VSWLWNRPAPSPGSDTVIVLTVPPTEHDHRFLTSRFETDNMYTELFVGISCWVFHPMDR